MKQKSKLLIIVTAFMATLSSIIEKSISLVFPPLLMAGGGILSVWFHIYRFTSDGMPMELAIITGGSLFLTVLPTPSLKG